MLVERYERARRRLPERRLHPVQGAAAPRPRARGRRGGGRARASRFGEPEIDLDGVRAFKDGAVKRLTDGLAGMAKTRRVEVVRGTARFTGPQRARRRRRPRSPSSTRSSPSARTRSRCPDLPDDPRIVDSTGALELPDVPERLLVIGGGIIGLEMATVHDALGSKVVVVEMLDQLIAGADPDVVKPLRKRIEKRYEAIHLETKVEEIRATDDGIVAVFGGNGGDLRPRARGGRPPPQRRRRSAPTPPGVEVDERGFISVDEQMRTNVAPHLRHRRRRRGADARPQGHARGQGRRRGDRGRERRLRRHARSRASPTPIPRSPGWG